MLLKYDNTSKDSIFNYAQNFKDKSLRDVLSKDEIEEIERQIKSYDNKRKGHFGDLVEQYLFGIENNSDAAPDFSYAGIELKTTPLKTHVKNKFVAKERLVFSMINYLDVVSEVWESSSFLKKNKLLLLMFYLYTKDIDLTRYEFKLIHLLDMFADISIADIAQIQNDWQKIIDKIKAGEAHLLSEADTAYLSAATKASNATVTRPQPYNSIPAKPRAFSFKPSYLNYIIQSRLGREDNDAVSLLDDTSFPLTIEENIKMRFAPYLGRTNIEMEEELGITYEKRPKNHRRVLVNRLFGTASAKIKELEKADITLRVMALEASGKLVESISFPMFRYEDIVHETWEESSFYEQLTTKRFLFIVFKKVKDGIDVLEKVIFWNFPMQDIDEARWVWEETVKRIKEKKADALPGIRENVVAHVRPHARDGDDKIPTGYGTEEVKKCFWLNAKYIEKQLIH